MNRESLSWLQEVAYAERRAGGGARQPCPQRAVQPEQLTQAEVAERANVSLGALRHLESGSGATVSTLVKVLRALGQEDWLDHLGARARPLVQPARPPCRPLRPTEGARTAPRASPAERPGGELRADRRHRGPGLGPAGRRRGPQPGDRLVLLRLRHRVGRRRHRAGPAAHGVAHAALRVPPAAPRDLLRARHPSWPTRCPTSSATPSSTAWMAEQGVAAGDITPLDRLAYAADRAMGALEFRPPARDAGSEPPTRGAAGRPGARRLVSRCGASLPATRRPTPPSSS